MKILNSNPEQKPKGVAVDLAKKFMEGRETSATEASKNSPDTSENISSPSKPDPVSKT
jgi:hypothetical protein